MAKREKFSIWGSEPQFKTSIRDTLGDLLK